MKQFKAKSLKKGVTDFDVANGTHIVEFMSFERAIKLATNDDVKGYRVTEQGIEIVFE